MPAAPYTAHLNHVLNTALLNIEDDNQDISFDKRNKDMWVQLTTSKTYIIQSHPLGYPDRFHPSREHVIFRNPSLRIQHEANLLELIPIGLLTLQGVTNLSSKIRDDEYYRITGPDKTPLFSAHKSPNKLHNKLISKAIMRQMKKQVLDKGFRVTLKNDAQQCIISMFRPTMLFSTKIDVVEVSLGQGNSPIGQIQKKFLDKQYTVTNEYGQLVFKLECRSRLHRIQRDDIEFFQHYFGSDPNELKYAILECPSMALVGQITSTTNKKSFEIQFNRNIAISLKALLLAATFLVVERFNRGIEALEDLRRKERSSVCENGLHPTKAAVVETGKYPSKESLFTYMRKLKSTCFRELENEKVSCLSPNSKLTESIESDKERELIFDEFQPTATKDTREDTENPTSHLIGRLSKAKICPESYVDNSNSASELNETKIQTVTQLNPVCSTASTNQHLSQGEVSESCNNCSSSATSFAKVMRISGPGQNSTTALRSKRIKKILLMQEQIENEIRGCSSAVFKWMDRPFLRENYEARKSTRRSSTDLSGSVVGGTGKSRPEVPLQRNMQIEDYENGNEIPGAVDPPLIYSNLRKKSCLFTVSDWGSMMSEPTKSVFNLEYEIEPSISKEEMSIVEEAFGGKLHKNTVASQTEPTTDNSEDSSSTHVVEISNENKKLPAIQDSHNVKISKNAKKKVRFFSEETL